MNGSKNSQLARTKRRVTVLAVKLLVWAVEKWKARRACPVCGDPMSSVAFYGPICFNRTCENYRGNRALGKMLK